MVSAFHSVSNRPHVPVQFARWFSHAPAVKPESSDVVADGQVSLQRATARYERVAPLFDTAFQTMAAQGDALKRLDTASGALTNRLGASQFNRISQGAMARFLDKHPRLARAIEDHPVLLGMPTVIGMSALCSFAGDGVKGLMTDGYKAYIRPTAEKVLSCLSETVGPHLPMHRLEPLAAAFTKVSEHPRVRTLLGFASMGTLAAMAASQFMGIRQQAAQSKPEAVLAV